MKRTLASVIAAAVLVSGVGAGMAQTSTAPKSPDTTTKSTTESTKPARMDNKAAGKHSVQGEVTRVDAKDGWVHVKTSEGTMVVHVPPSDLGSVKKGDMVALDLSITGNGPAPKK